MTKKELHERALRDFDRIQSALHEEREQALEDRRFYSISGAQWEGSLHDQFENRPQFEVNKVHLAVIKIINEYRNNRVTVHFITKDGQPTDEFANTCAGLFRADEQDSSAQEAYDNAFEEAVGGGFGAFRVINEYEDPGDEENDKQRIRIEPVYDADTSVFFDLDAKKQDKSDAKYCFVMYSVTRDAFEEEWGEIPTSVNKQISEVEYDWFTPDVVHVAEYYVVEEVKEKIFIYVTLAEEEKRFKEADFEENPNLEQRLAAEGTVFDRERTVYTRKVRKYVLSGNKILEDCGYIAGEHIPIIPVYGKRWFVDNVERCMGHVRLVKDAQRLKNMLLSKLAEISSLSTIEKPIFTPEQIAGNEIMWAEDNIKNYPYLLVNSIIGPDGNEMPSGPLGYTKPPAIPPALAGLMSILDVDLRELLGNAMETDQMLSHVSGKAHELIQKRIDGQAYIFMDNFAKAIRRLGEVWLSMARDVYVEENRRMKTVDPMGEISSAVLTSPGLASSEGSNIMSKATFDVRVDVGPSSSSQREASVQTLINMMGITQDPQTQNVLQALALYNMQGEGLSEARDFFRKQLVGMGVLPPTEEEAKAMAEQEEEPSAQEQALLAMAAKDEAEAQKTQAEIVKVLSDVDLNKAKTMETFSEIETQQLDRAMELMQQLEQELQPPASGQVR